MSKIKVIILILLLAASSTAFFFKDSILKIYNNFSGSIQTFEKTNLGDIISEVRKEILSPPPLNVGGAETKAVLTGAKIIAQTNIQRYDNGLLPPLIENAKLGAAALVKANDMFKNQYFEHISPSGVGPGDLVKNYGYDYIVTGENVILGNFKDEKEVVRLWMNSPGHRANILNDRFAEIGAAVIKGSYKGQTVWIGVQEFGLPLSACEQPNRDLKNWIDLNQRKLDQLSLQIEEKKFEIDNAKLKSERYNQLANEHNQLVIQYNQTAQETKNLILQYNNQVNIFNQCVSGI